MFSTRSPAGTGFPDPSPFKARPRGAAAVGGALEPVVERLDFLDSQRRGDQPVGEPGVLRQQRPVQVGPDHVGAARALDRCRAVVAVAAQHPPERLALGAEVVRPPWFSKPASTRAPAVELDLDRDVADQPRAVARAPCAVEQADALDLLVAERVGAARAAGSRRRRRARPRRAPAAACSASRLRLTRSLRTAAGRGPGRRRGRRGRARRGRAPRRACARRARSRSRATRSGARSISRLPRSA